MKERALASSNLLEDEDYVIIERTNSASGSRFISNKFWPRLAANEKLELLCLHFSNHNSIIDIWLLYLRENLTRLYLILSIEYNASQHPLDWSLKFLQEESSKHRLNQSLVIKPLNLDSQSFSRTIHVWLQNDRMSISDLKMGNSFLLYQLYLPFVCWTK